MDGTTTNLVPVREQKRSTHTLKRTRSPGDPRFLMLGLKTTERVIDLLGLAERAAPPSAPGASIRELTQANPAFMGQMLSPVHQAGVLNGEALTTLGEGGDGDDDGAYNADDDDLEFVLEGPTDAPEAARHPSPR